MREGATILVTGANGFIGRELCATLARQGWRVRAATRRLEEIPGVAENFLVAGIDANTDWSQSLAGVDAVAHLAARVHVLNDGPDNSSLYDSVNTDGTLQLARAAAAAGVRDFLFVSSIKVSGEERATAYRSDEAPAPVDAYGRSKLAAELGLRKIASASTLRVAIVRPPLVYGVGVGGNFRRLMRLVARGMPLPLGSIHNRRSIVSTWNLCDLVCRLLANPVQSDLPWLVSDGEPLSTPELVRKIAQAMGRKARILPVPVSMMRVAARLMGRLPEVSRLSDSLTVDCSLTRSSLAWSPPLDPDVAIRRTVDAFLISEAVHVD